VWSQACIAGGLLQCLLEPRLLALLVAWPQAALHRTLHKQQEPALPQLMNSNIVCKVR
jgi:hypothetical protein